MISYKLCCLRAKIKIYQFDSLLLNLSLSFDMTYIQIVFLKIPFFENGGAKLDFLIFQYQHYFIIDKNIS